ncbi:glycosyltransferase family 2 protein [Collinsella intestinalis]|uniref:glycosyltransferase family 2 protein n=1 Tax=Collinsella intestinalis TaxID=147207 RepID=UPI00195CC3D2|nr:glycosyltransferase family 2 protein [Collinsella intestinalis]MBM6941571.1 glycosyltransferase family 2 protein [Collinsella intestinalis]
MPFFPFLADWTPITVFNYTLMMLLSVLCFYQLILFVVGLLKGEVSYPPAKRLHRYAFFIAAHNEEPVIGNLVRSILDQDYPSELIDVFVVADACTDNTAEAARRAGAIVYERNDLARKGKSWVMDYGFRRILEQYPGRHEGFFIFDADNLVSRDYTRIMNDAFDQGYQAVTSYRNSKNFGSSWISAAYATSFIREARFLNNARMLCGTSCAVSGSGYLISADIVRGMQGWRFHTLTEDIQFSTFCAVHGIRIAYAPAEFFDEQPVTFKASWKQRMRWTKGFYQVFFTYGLGLFKSFTLFRRFAAYDFFVTVGPGTIFTMLSTVANLAFLVVGSLSHGFLATAAELDSCFVSLITMLATSYLTFFIGGLIVVIVERKHFYCPVRWRFVANLFTYPLFMLTYIPINVVALFRKVDWVPTPHNVAITLDDVVKEPTA